MSMLSTVQPHRFPEKVVHVAGGVTHSKEPHTDGGMRLGVPDNDRVGVRLGVGDLVVDRV